jgi:hypothetical protein
MAALLAQLRKPARAHGQFRVKRQPKDGCCNHELALACVVIAEDACALLYCARGRLLVSHPRRLRVGRRGLTELLLQILQRDH